MSLIRNPKDFWAGLLFMAFGLATLVTGWPYPPGTVSRMGPGYFPRMLAILLLGLGAVLSLQGLRPTEEAPVEWHYQPLAIVLLSVGAFGLVAMRLGVVVASLALVFLSSAASREFRRKEAVISGAIQAIVAALVFVYGLGVPLPLWPTFLTGGP